MQTDVSMQPPKKLQVTSQLPLHVHPGLVLQLGPVQLVRHSPEYVVPGVPTAAPFSIATNLTVSFVNRSFFVDCDDDDDTSTSDARIEG